MAAGVGSAAALGAVMAPALTRLGAGWEAAVSARPEVFPWGLYLAGWLAVAWAAWRVASGRSLPPTRLHKPARRGTL
jgi:hypothetical protein